MTWLSYFLAQEPRIISASELARRANTNRQTVSDLRKGKIVMSKEWAERLAPHLGCEPEELIFGPKRATPNSDIPVLNVPVRGVVAAGIWIEPEMDALPADVPSVPAIESPYGRPAQFAYRVEGPSMTRRRIWPGDYVICVPYWLARTMPVDGDIVVVERAREQLVERTCKELRFQGPKLLLVPHSDDPRFQTPLICERTDHAMRAEDGSTIELIGLVIGRYAPI
jgi:SOS-response transcriptional repressor LexA